MIQAPVIIASNPNRHPRPTIVCQINFSSHYQEQNFFLLPSLKSYFIIKQRWSGHMWQLGSVGRCCQIGEGIYGREWGPSDHWGWRMTACTVSSKALLPSERCTTAVDWAVRWLRMTDDGQDLGRPETLSDTATARSDVRLSVSHPECGCSWVRGTWLLSHLSDDQSPITICFTNKCLHE